MFTVNNSYHRNTRRASHEHGNRNFTELELKTLLSTGNDSQYLVTTTMGKKSEKEYVYMWVNDWITVYLKLTAW